MTTKEVVVFGLQRSGTNYLEQLMVRNFNSMKVRNNRDQHPSYTWKHSYGFYMRRVDSSIIHLYVVKNPYVWIDSMIRKKVTSKHHLSIISHYKDILEISDPAFNVHGLDIVKMAKLWNDHSIWFHSDAVRTKLDYTKILYKDLISSEENLVSILKEIHDKHGLDRKEKYIENPDKVDQSNLWTDEAKLRYMADELEYLPKDKLPLISEHLNEGILTLCKVKKL